MRQPNKFISAAANSIAKVVYCLRFNYHNKYTVENCLILTTRLTMQNVFSFL